MSITNNSNVPLALAVWAVDDNYDYITGVENYISVTSLMKPIRHIVLPKRVPPQDIVEDVSEYISRAMGHSLHDSIEKAWVNNYAKNLDKLGYPKDVIARVLINPPKEVLKPDSIPIYLEQRKLRTIVVDGVAYTIGGKFDMVAEGIVHDNKSTTVFSWVKQGKDDDYKMQGSLYRWLNPDIITEDFIRICFIFTDWQRSMVKTVPNYPPQRAMFRDIPLMSIQETEEWVINKIRSITKNKDLPEPQLPKCTDEELWMSEPIFKYYADPSKTDGRSTKNFETAREAKAFMIEKAGKGVMKTVPGQAKRCGYCSAFPICTQKDTLNHA